MKNFIKHSFIIGFLCLAVMPLSSALTPIPILSQDSTSLRFKDGEQMFDLQLEYHPAGEKRTTRWKEFLSHPTDFAALQNIYTQAIFFARTDSVGNLPTQFDSSVRIVGFYSYQPGPTPYLFKKNFTMPMLQDPYTGYSFSHQEAFMPHAAQLFYEYPSYNAPTMELQSYYPSEFPYYGTSNSPQLLQALELLRTQVNSLQEQIKILTQQKSTASEDSPEAQIEKLKSEVIKINALLESDAKKSVTSNIADSLIDLPEASSSATLESNVLEITTEEAIESGEKIDTITSIEITPDLSSAHTSEIEPVDTIQITTRLQKLSPFAVEFSETDFPPLASAAKTSTQDSITDTVLPIIPKEELSVSIKTPTLLNQSQPKETIQSCHDKVHAEKKSPARNLSSRKKAPEQFVKKTTQSNSSTPKAKILSFTPEVLQPSAIQSQIATSETSSSPSKKSDFYLPISSSKTISTQELLAEQEARRIADEEAEQRKREIQAERKGKKAIQNAQKRALAIAQEQEKKTLALEKKQELYQKDLQLLTLAAEQFNQQKDLNLCCSYLKQITSEDIQSTYQYAIMIAGLTLKTNLLSPEETSKIRKALKKIIRDLEASGEKTDDDTLVIAYGFLAKFETDPDLKKYYLKKALEEGNLYCGIQLFLLYMYEEIPCSNHRDSFKGCYFYAIEKFIDEILKSKERDVYLAHYDFYKLAALFYGKFSPCPHEILINVDRLGNINLFHEFAKKYLTAAELKRFEEFIDPLKTVKVSTFAESVSFSQDDGSGTQTLTISLTPHTDTELSIGRTGSSIQDRFHETMAETTSEDPIAKTVDLEKILVHIGNLHSQINAFTRLLNDRTELATLDLIEFTKLCRNVLRILSESGKEDITAHELITIREKTFPLISMLFNAQHISPFVVAKIIALSELTVFDTSFIFFEATKLKDRIEDATLQQKYLVCLHALIIGHLQKTQSMAESLLRKEIFSHTKKTSPVMKFLKEQRLLLISHFPYYRLPIEMDGKKITADELEALLTSHSIVFSKDMKNAYEIYVERYAKNDFIKF